MSNEKNNSPIGFMSLLQLAFIILKLCNVIKWSWVWVLCPIWGSITLVLLVLIIMWCVGVIWEKINRKRFNKSIDKMNKHTPLLGNLLEKKFEELRNYKK
jgi:NADH:ubiquinone oxidoreductase subunit 6 (subunit J)